jgi:DNA-binding ferritin-like protein
MNTLPLTKLAARFRAMQLFAHNAHLTTKGATFYQDHDAFGDLYPVYETAFDALVERTIGLGGEYDAQASFKQVGDFLAPTWGCVAPDDCFDKLMEFEKRICSDITDVLTRMDVTQGVSNFLQGLADDSEKRQYKIKQRLKK